MTDSGSPDVYTASNLDRILDALANQQRRAILDRLRRDKRLQPFQGPTALNSADLELYHVHCPKLEAAGYIEWNRNTGTITKGPQYDEVATFLTLIETQTDNRLVTDNE